MIFLDEMYKEIFIDEELRNKVFVDHEIRDDKDDYFESTDIFRALFGLNEEIEHHYLRLISQTNSSEYIAQIAKTPEERFYVLYVTLRNHLTNKNLKEGISGVTLQYHKYYQMYQAKDVASVFKPEPAVPKKSKISKETREEIGVDNNERDNPSYDTSMHIIQRSDFSYEKIYLFHKYEFSNNVAYEFAKRARYPFAELEDIHILKHIILEIFYRTHSKNISIRDNQLDLIQKIISIDDNFCALFDFFINKNLTIKDIYNDFFNLPSISKNKFYTEYKDYFKENLQYYEIIHEGYFLKCSQHFHSVFLPRYKSPMLEETVLFTNDYRMNISLPKDELIDYVINLKNDFDKSIENETVNILELMFGHKERYYDEIANMLFIYDSIRVGFKYEHIEHSLTDFEINNIDKGINKKIPKDRKTIRKYFFFAKLLIEEEYYRSIVTPIYSNDIISELKDKIDKIKKSNA